MAQPDEGSEPRPGLRAVGDDGGAAGGVDAGGVDAMTERAAALAGEAAERAGEAADRAADLARQVGADAWQGAQRAGRGVADATGSLLRSRWWRVRNTPNRRRLRSEVGVFATRLEGTERRIGQRAPWMDAADALTVGAARALKDQETIEGWSLLWAAEREGLDGLRREELVSEGEAAVAEARYVLAPEQAEGVALRVGRLDDTVLTSEMRAQVRGARDLLDRLRGEVYRRLREEGRRLSGLAVLVVAFLVAAGLAVGLGVTEGEAGEVLDSMSEFLSVAGIGACGAVLSMLVPWRLSANRPALVDFVNPTDLVALRIGTGAAMAVAVLVVLQAGDLSGLTGAQAYPWAFAAGFGERLIDKRLASVDESARDLEAG